MKNNRIITFGGGTGQFHLLDGLREAVDTKLITAVAGTWDTGGSSGRLRTELGVLPPGDIRRCILALMEDREQRMVAQRLFDDRLEEMVGPLRGHSLGNLITTRLDYIYRGQDRAIDAERKLFRINAKILPATLTNIQLIAETFEGNKVEGETNIDYRSKSKDFNSEDKIARIYFDSRADANQDVLDEISKAEKIIFAPGDLYTSILPHLLVDSVSEAILKSSAKLIVVLNLATKSGETDAYKASDYLKAFTYYLGSTDRINYLIVNNNELDKEIVNLYKMGGQNMVEIDSEECLRVSPSVNIISADVASYYKKEHLLRHSPEKLASIILNI